MTHYVRYALGNLLMVAAGFVSFPITTRLLSNAEFGVLSYWETGLMLLVAVLKLGGGDAIVRFYPQKAGDGVMLRYSTNFVLLPSLAALAGWCLTMTIAAIGAWQGWIDTPTTALFAFAQVLPLVWGGFVLRVMQGRELSGLNTVVSVAWRWLLVATTLAVLLFITPTATGVFIGRLFAHLLMAGYLVYWLTRNLPFHWSLRDWAYAAEGFRFGVPLAMMEISNVLLGYIDRVMLKWLLNDFASVGIYSIGYALATYLGQLISVSLTQATGPVLNRIYENEGAAGVRRFKSAVMGPLVYVCVGLIAGLLISGTDALAMLASQDKAASGPVFVLLGTCFLIVPIVFVAGEGLLLEKKSGVVFVVTAGAALVNVALNLVFIPRFGYMGAAYASGICQIGRQVLLYVCCPRDFRVLPQLTTLGYAGTFATLCVAIGWGTGMFGLSGPFVRFSAAAGLMLVLYALPLIVVDRQLRQLVGRLVRTLRQA
jgi:O-antigen/teichoic acid export membrane protein